MCDDSLENQISRSAEVGDKLVTSSFRMTPARGFCCEKEPGLAVCLLPGTEIAFEEPVRYNGLWGALVNFMKRRLGHDMSEAKLARFRQVDLDNPHTHHDAIELANGRLTALRGAIIDVSARVGVERELRKASRLRSMVFEAARMAAWHFDIVGNRFSCTDELLSLLDIRGEDFDGTPRALENAIHPEDREAWIKARRKRARREFARAMLQGGSFTLEFPIIRPDGTEIWTALAGDVVKDAQGRPVSARGIDQDITERKNWEKRQAMLLRELSHRVKHTLAVVQSVARQTLRSSPTPRSFVEAFEGAHAAAQHHRCHDLRLEPDQEAIGERRQQRLALFSNVTKPITAFLATR